MAHKMNTETYHVALSYASEQKEYVDKVAEVLQSLNVRYFYDKNEEVPLWGKNLPEVFQNVFEGGQSHFVVVFVSEEYIEKFFPKIELGFSISRQIQEKKEYILPVRFDDSKIPGLPGTLKYIDLQGVTPKNLANKIVEKLQQAGVYLGSNTSAQTNVVKTTKNGGADNVIFEIVDENGKPVKNADIFLVHQNGTYRSTKSDNEGKAFIANADRNVIYTIFVAHPEFPACIVDNYNWGKSIEITLKRKSGVCSQIFPNGTGYIPNINGRLNPILDASSRTYLYADNISINNNPLRPTHFKFGENISLVDNVGSTADIIIHRIIQQCIILDYKVH
ncbi:MAG: TIR domain-containing protein [Salinispira sp.]